MKPFVVVGRLRVETEASIWLIEADRYMRLPKSEAPRPPFFRGDGALDDARWHQHRGVFLMDTGDGEFVVRLLPAWRPAGSAGITSGIVVTTSPPLDTLVDDGDRDDSDLGSDRTLNALRGAS